MNDEAALLTEHLPPGSLSAPARFGWWLAQLERELDQRPTYRRVQVQVGHVPIVTALAKRKGFREVQTIDQFNPDWRHLLLTLTDGLGTPTECFSEPGSTLAWDSIESLDLEPGTWTVEHRKVVPTRDHLPSITSVFEFLRDYLSDWAETTEAVTIDLTAHLLHAIELMLDEAARAVSGWIAGDLIETLEVTVADDGTFTTRPAAPDTTTGGQ